MAVVIALHKIDTQGFQLSAHGWINIFVTTADLVAELFGNNSQAAHERATNAKDMNMHNYV